MDSREERRAKLKLLLDRAAGTPLEAGALQWIVESILNPTIHESEIRSLRFEMGDVLEFCDIGGEFITRFTRRGSQPSDWVLSDKATVVAEVARVTGSRPRQLQQFAEIYNYEQYPATGESIAHFAACYVEKDYESKSLEVAIVGHLLAYWVSGISGTIERGWTTVEGLPGQLSRFKARYS